MSSQPVSVTSNTDPMFAGTDGHTEFLEPAEVQTFNLSGHNVAVNYDSKYSRSALSLIDGNTAVKISAVETTTSGQPYGLNIETSARFRDTTSGSTNTSLQYIEGNVTVKADTIIQGNLLVQDFTYPPTANRNVSGGTRRVGISATNFHTESKFVEENVLANFSNPVTTLTSQGVISNRGGHNYCSKVDIDDQGVRIGTVLNAGNASDRLVLDRVYVENDLRLGSTQPYTQALPGNQAYPGVDPCLDINDNTSLFTTRKGPIGRVALNSNNVDIVFSDDSAPLTIVTTTSVDQDSKDYVFPRTAVLGDVVNNISFLTDGPMADEIKRRIGTLDSSIQSVDLGDLKATDTKFSSYVSSPVGGVFNLRDTAGILKALNLKVDAIGQGLTPELLNTILDIANRLQGSEQYNIMAELSLLQRSIGYLTNRLDSLTAEEFDLKDNFASTLLALDTTNRAFVHYRTAILNRLSSDTKNYSTVSAGIYYKYTGYNLAVGGVRSTLENKEYYYNPHSGSGFFYDSTMGKWAYVTGVCLYTSAAGLLTKDDKTLYDDFVPEERSISTVFTGAGNSLWSFDSKKNYEDSYYGSMTTNFLSLYAEEANIPALSNATDVIVSLTDTLNAVSTVVSAFWESLTPNQKLAFSGKNFTDLFSSAEYIRNDMKVLGVSFGTMLDTNVQAFAKDFSSDTAYNNIKTVVSPLVSAAATVVYPVSTVLDEEGQPASEGWYSSLAGRRVFRQRRYQFQDAGVAFDGWPVFGFTADTKTEGSLNVLTLTYISGVDDTKRDDLKNYILVAANGTSIICWGTTDSNSPGWRRFEFTGTVAILIKEKLFHMSLNEALPGEITSMSFAYDAVSLPPILNPVETSSSIHIDFDQQSVLRREVVTCNFTVPS